MYQILKMLIFSGSNAVEFFAIIKASVCTAALSGSHAGSGVSKPGL